MSDSAVNQDDLDDDSAELDGRRARRDRNRDAVVDALLDLIGEGDVSPGVADVAERSGVSHRSVFRYFSDLQELFRVAVTRSVERFSSLVAIGSYGEGSLDQRIDALVAQRITFFEAAGPIMAVGRARAQSQPVLAADIKANRSIMREQLGHHFGTQLDTFDAADRSARLAAVDVLASYESWSLWRNDQGLSPEVAGRCLKISLHRLLTP